MPETASTSETKLFVDDSLLFRTITNQADRELLQKHWKNGKNNWQMSLNAKKSGHNNITEKSTSDINNIQTTRPYSRHN